MTRDPTASTESPTSDRGAVSPGAEDALARLFALAKGARGRLRAVRGSSVVESVGGGEVVTE